MGIYDQFADTPNEIKKEGQEITLIFSRTGPSTGRLSWNIPAPSAGCNTDMLAYDGIVLTVASKPANYISTSPQDGKYYTGDPTVDPDLHAGDKLDGALVLAAIYADKTTTFVNITDLQPKTAYYFSGYAVDKVARYHREGVHSYSLPIGPEVANDQTDKPAIQDIGIDAPHGLTPSTLTGLQEGKKYTLAFLIDGKKYTLSIDGTRALDYDDLIYQINQEFIRLTVPKYTSPYPPNANGYYVDIPKQKVYLWTGYESIPQEALFTNDDPSTPILGTYWYNPETKILSVWESSGWVEKDYKISVFDFSDPKCYQFWFDGTDVYKWEKVLWCQLPTFIGTANPLIGPPLDCNTFWYDIDNQILAQWDIQIHKWNAVNAIYSDVDPNSVPSGAYWYNQHEKKVFYRSASQWNMLNAVTYDNPLPNGDYPGIPFANIYWFVPNTQKLYRRNASNTIWVELDVILYPTDPTDRSSCQLWWNSTTDVLYIWDIVNVRWVEVSAFFQQSADPTLPQDIPIGSAWYNPETEIITIINNPDCTPVNYVYSLTDPTIMVVGQIWYNPEVNKWFEWDGTGWQEIAVLINKANPYILTVGELWFNTASNQLNRWNGTAWVEIQYSTTPLIPKTCTACNFTECQLWFNPTTEKLYEWNGTTWVETIGIAAAKLIMLNDFTCNDCIGTHYWYYNYNDGWSLPYPKDIIRFHTKCEGCKVRIELCWDGGSDFVFANIGKQPYANIPQQVIYFEPMYGYTALPSPPMYAQLGVGTSGNPDERRNLHEIIRVTLGAPTVTVELTKTQIDTCIDNAIAVLRKNSNLSYTRNMFFLDVNPNQQLYFLKDKCVGFNKIVDINAIYRMGAGWYNLGQGGDNFGYAALSQLYTLGTFDMLSFHLVSAYIEELQTLFASNIMYQWVERSRELKMYQVFYNRERVLVDTTIERTEQDLLSDRETRMWLQKWATAEAKLMLSQSRGKFQTLPGPNGNTTLNAQDLISQANDEMNALKEELNDFIMQDAIDIGMRSHFIIG